MGFTLLLSVIYPFTSLDIVWSPPPCLLCSLSPPRPPSRLASTWTQLSNILGPEGHTPGTLCSPVEKVAQLEGGLTAVALIHALLEAFPLQGYIICIAMAMFPTG